MTPYLRWCISDDCKLSGVLPLCRTVGNGVSTCSRPIMSWISHGYMLYILWMSADFCPEFNMIWVCLRVRCPFWPPKYHFEEQKRTPHFETSLYVDFTNFTRNFESMLYHFLFFSFWWSYFEILMSNRRQNIVQFICSWYAVLKTSQLSFCKKVWFLVEN